MVTKVKNFTMIRGDTVRFSLSFKNLDEDPDEIWFSVRENYDAPYIFQKSLDDGITQDDDGYAVRIAPEDTQELEAGKYVYDLEIKIDDDVYTPLTGRLDIAPDVTRRPME